MKILFAFWEVVAQEMGMNCFILEIVCADAQYAAIADSVVLFKDPQKSLDVLKAADLDMVLEGLSAEIVIDVDHDFFATARCITEEDMSDAKIYFQEKNCLL